MSDSDLDAVSIPDDEDRESECELPPALTYADLLRQLSEEGRRLLVSALDDTSEPTARAQASKSARALPAPSARELEVELDDARAIFGDRSVSRLVPGPDASFTVQLRLKIQR